MGEDKNSVSNFPLLNAFPEASCSFNSLLLFDQRTNRNVMEIPKKECFEEEEEEKEDVCELF